MNGYMFDTNIFNSILDSKVDLTFLAGKSCFVTHVQYDEIRATSNSARQSQLASVFSSIPQQEISTESFVLDVSRLGQAKLSDGDLYHRLRARLDQMNKKKHNNPQDVLIAETAIANELTLVTHDRDLYLVTTEFGGASCNLPHVLKLV